MLIPEKAIDICEGIMYKYRHKGDGWLGKDVHYHLTHAIVHLNKVASKAETTEDDLAHAAVRLLMALAVRGQQ